MGARPRASDVAAAAGVSTTTVSFVLNGRDVGNISAATRDRVLKAAEELGYHPNHVAASLRRRSTASIGLVTDAFASSPFGGRLLAAATETARLADHVLLMMDLGRHLGDLGNAITALERRQVDALIYANMGFSVLDAVPTGNVPVVLANCTANNPDELSVRPDDAGGAVAALEHLADLGHRTVAMLGGHHWPGRKTGDQGNISGPIRWAAFHRAAEARGVVAQHAGEGWNIDDGYRTALAVLDTRTRPSALFAACDRVATGALLAASHLGLDVPGDVSIIGFDDQESLAESVVPALTTIALPHAAMGKAAVCLALAAIRGESPEPGRLVLDCPLVVRNSTSPPR